MKTLKESISSINEGRDASFRVSFNGFKDEEGLPITVEIVVPLQYERKFEKYLEKEEGNTIANACNDNRNWEL